MKTPLSERVCDTACLLFALWTVAAHLVVAAGGNGYQLLTTTIAITLIPVGLWIARRRRRRDVATSVGSPGEELEPRETVAPLSRTLPAVRLVGIAVALGVVATYAYSREIVTLWWAMLAILSGAAAIMIRGSAPPSEPVLRSRSAERALWMIAIGCALFTLACHRPDDDDAFYINVAATVADHPEWSLLASDTMHGIADLPLLSAVYRLHSFELLNGALSLLTGIPAIACFHWISATLAALLVPLCLARLFRVLMPRQWLWGVGVCLLVLLSNGDVHRAYGNYAFVRLWQGKAIFVTALLPLIFAYALRHAAAPTRRTWLLLCAAQIAALGLTSTALYVAPVAAGLALLSGAGPGRRALRATLSGLLASAYLVMAGLTIRSTVVDSIAQQMTGAEPVGHHLAIAFDKVLGTGRFELLAIAAIVTTWALWRRGATQRFAIIIPLGLLVLIGNPYLESLVMANLTGGPSIHWRLMWLIPVPVLISLLLCSPLQPARGSIRVAGAGVLVAVGLAIFVLTVPEHLSFSAAAGPRRITGVRIGTPALKVPPQPYRWAEKLNRSAGPGAVVVAPREVNTWIPTFHHHAYPVEVRRLYTRNYVRRQLLPQQDAALRGHLVDVVSQWTWAKNVVSRRRAQDRFAAGLQKYDVRAVCLRKNRASGYLSVLLRREEFRLVDEDGIYELWVRS